MDFNEIPTLRFEISGIKSSILAHLGIRGSELGAAVDAEIERAVASYPWEDEVCKIVHEGISAAIKGHFVYGAGRKQIDDAIKEGLEKLILPSTPASDTE